MTKILFVAQNFHMGGIAKALVNTVNELCMDEQYQISVFTFSDGVLRASLNEKVRVKHAKRMLRVVSTPFSNVLKSKNIVDIIFRAIAMVLVRIIGSKKFYGLLFSKEKIDEKYDVAISYFHDNPNTFFYQGTNQFVSEYLDTNCKIAWLHTDPISAGFKKNDLLETYKHFDRVICVSNECKRNLQSLVPEIGSHIRVVYNFTPIDDILKNKDCCCNVNFPDNKIVLVSLGRIDNHSKRFDIIPQVCISLIPFCSDFIWVIIGDGPDLTNNMNAVKQMNLDSYIKYVGGYNNPYPLLKHADLLVITSAYEGYPMVLGEAFTLGVPVCCTPFAAATELISSDNGYISCGFSVTDISETLKAILLNKGTLVNKKLFLSYHPVNNTLPVNQFNNLLKELSVS